MKKIYVLPLLLLLITQSLFSQYSSNGIGRWKLGLNVGATWQTANINSKPFDLGYGATLEYAVYQKYNSFFGFSLRGRFLRGRTTGYNKLLHNQSISNDNINGTLDSNTNYSSLPLYLNNRTKLNEFSLEAMLKWNKLYQNHGILFYLYLGGGFTQYTVHTDQLDEFGNLYDYSSIDPGSSSTVDQLENLLDGDFETELSNADYNSMVFTPAFGVGFGFRIAPGFDIAWEHKVSLPQTDLFEGQEYSTSDPSFVKDIYHYSSLGLIFSIVGDVEPSVYTPPVEPSEPIIKDELVVQPKRPIITLVKPTVTTYVKPNCKADIEANIKHVTKQSDIEFYQNGVKVPSYKYFFAPPTFKSSIELKDGKNTFKIIAKNQAFTETKTFTLACNTVNKIAICHKNANGTSSNMLINESEWAIHAAHGDIKGDCPEKQITICHNLPGQPGKTQTITIKESEWNLHKSHGDYMGNCAEKKMITICHSNQTITIDEKDWPTHAAHGDTKGDCPQVQEKMITICHVPKTGNKRIVMQIPEREWIVHQAHGDTKGACPSVEPTITICHKNANGSKSTMQIPEFRWNEHFSHGDSKGACPEASFIICHTDPVTKKKENISITESLWAQHAAHGDTRGACPKVDKQITICHNVPGQPGKTQTITIPESKWNLHKSHGDKLGPCISLEKTITICHKSANGNTKMTIRESEWAAHAAHGDTKGDCPEKQITVCHNVTGKPGLKKTITIPESMWSFHQSHGDVLGTCVEPEKKINICHKNANGTSSNISINESEWAAHAAHGDTKGDCPIEQKKITICHNVPGKPGETQTITIPESLWNIHKSHGDVKGACKPVDKLITICHVITDPKELSTSGQVSPYKTIQIRESEWAAHAAHGDTKGACVQKERNIEICHNIPGQPGKTQTITIKESEWNLHKSHGDLKRPCAPSTGSGGGNNGGPSGGIGSGGSGNPGGGKTEKKIKICHIPPGNKSNPQTIEIPESAWPAHQAHGDTKGACKPSTGGSGNGGNSGSNGGLGTGGNSNSGGGKTEKKIKICHIPPGNKNNPQTIEIPESAWPAHQAHGDTKGECKPSPKKGSIKGKGKSTKTIGKTIKGGR